jgi:hypothetical protein
MKLATFPLRFETITDIEFLWVLFLCFSEKQISQYPNNMKAEWQRQQ